MALAGVSAVRGRGMKHKQVNEHLGGLPDIWSLWSCRSTNPFPAQSLSHTSWPVCSPSRRLVPLPIRAHLHRTHSQPPCPLCFHFHSKALCCCLDWKEIVGRITIMSCTAVCIPDVGCGSVITQLLGFTEDVQLLDPFVLRETSEAGAAQLWHCCMASVANQTS